MDQFHAQLKSSLPSSPPHQMDEIESDPEPAIFRFYINKQQDEETKLENINNNPNQNNNPNRNQNQSIQQNQNQNNNNNI